jgi:hypothetical protein
MQTTKRKLSLVVTAAFVSAWAHAGTFDVPVTSAGGGNLELFVTDLTLGKYFAQDLGIRVETVYPKSQIIDDGQFAPQTFKTFDAPLAIAGYDSALAAFLADKTGDQIIWTILSGDRSSTSLSLGSQRAMFTSSLDLTLGVPFKNTFVSTFTGNLTAFNSFINGDSSGYNGGNTSDISGYADNGPSGGQLARISWISASFTNGAPIGSAQTLYMFATSGGSGDPANMYLSGTITIDGQGNITVANAIPLPAAM